MIKSIILKSTFKTVFFLFSLILFFFSFITNAQNKKLRYFTEGAIGPTFPTGKFANKSYNGSFLSNTDGLAKTGVAANLSIGFHLKNNYGALLCFGISQNKQDANSFDRYLKNTYGSNINTSIKANNWNVFKIMAGGFFAAPFSPASKFSFQAKVLAGLFKTNIPGLGYTYSSTDNSVPIIGNLSFAKVSLLWSFCYQVNAGIKYQFTQKFYLVSEFGYFGGTSNYKYMYNPNFPMPGNLVTGEKKIALSSIQLMAGAGINF